MGGVLLTRRNVSLKNLGKLIIHLHNEADKFNLVDFDGLEIEYDKEKNKYNVFAHFHS